MSAHRPNILVCVEAVDAADPLMGYFTPWLRALAQQARVTAFALRVSDPPPALAPDAVVVPLRPRASGSRAAVVRTLLVESWKRRNTYDAVFVRGYPEYVVLAGWLWRLLGKRVVLFYAHYRSDLRWLRPASWFADAVLTSVPGACALPQAVPIGQGVDASRFPAPHVHVAGETRLLMLGRVSPVKRVDWAVAQLAAADPGAAHRLTVFGKETDAGAAAALGAACTASGAAWERRDVSPADVPGILARHDVFLNATPGSLDKTIVEAMLAGLVVVASSPGYGACLPDELAWLHPADAGFGAAAARAAGLAPEARAAIGMRLRAIARERHSQEHQMRTVLRLLVPGASA